MSKGQVSRKKLWYPDEFYEGDALFLNTGANLRNLLDVRATFDTHVMYFELTPALLATLENLRICFIF